MQLSDFVVGTYIKAHEWDNHKEVTRTNIARVLLDSLIDAYPQIVIIICVGYTKDGIVRNWLPENFDSEPLTAVYEEADFDNISFIAVSTHVDNLNFADDNFQLLDIDGKPWTFPLKNILAMGPDENHDYGDVDESFISKFGTLVLEKPTATKLN